ncbi:MAG: hypothetical protein IKI90_02225 [Treponema sp.]|nr:hypothetical protein [Treponema sp.]
MTSGHKTALSLLITVLTFSLLCVFAFAGGFNYIEMHFYEPRIVKNINQTLDGISTDFDEYISSLKRNFAGYVSDPKSKTFFERESTLTDIQDRQALTAEFMENNPGLEGIRVVDSQDRHIHYSTYPSDLMMQTEDYISYQDYNDSIPFSSVIVADTGAFAGDVEAFAALCSLYFDDAKDRFVFSYPYFDNYTAYRGTIIFYVNAQDFTRTVISKNLIALNTRSKIIAPKETHGVRQTAQNCGIVFGFPTVGRELLDSKILENWSKGQYEVEQLAQDENGDIMILVTGTTAKTAKIGWICTDQEFSFSQMEKALLLTCLFITLFLIIFMLFNLKHDDNVIIRERIHKFEMALFREYLERKESEDWSTLQKTASLRKQDVNAEIIKSLGSIGRKHSTEISRALDQSWTEFLHIISGSYKQSLEQFSSNRANTPAIADETKVEIIEPVQVPQNQLPAQADNVEEVQELEEIPEAEPVEELEEVPEAEAVEELEEVPEAEAVEELEQIPEQIEELEEIPEEDTDDEEDLEIPHVGSFVDPLDGTEDEEETEPEELEEAEEVEPLEDSSEPKENILKKLDGQDFEVPSFLELDQENIDDWKD